jgi:MYND finger
MENIPKCKWCGKTTTSFCDGLRCENSSHPNNPICDECQRNHPFALCPDCFRVGSDRYTTLDQQHQLIIYHQRRVCARCEYHAPRWRCAKCHVAWYCDERCQKMDWPRHKQLTCIHGQTYLQIMKSTNHSGLKKEIYSIPSTFLPIFILSTITQCNFSILATLLL